MSHYPHINGPSELGSGESADGWIDHDGGEMPIPGDRRVRVHYRNGTTSDPVLARQRRWKAWKTDIGESDWDIVSWSPE